MEERVKQAERVRMRNSDRVLFHIIVNMKAEPFFFSDLSCFLYQEADKGTISLEEMKRKKKKKQIS